MPRKYNPEVFSGEDRNSYGEYTEYYIAQMQESLDGQWVMLETYLNEQKRLQKQIDKLKAKIKVLEEPDNPVEPWPEWSLYS